MALQSVQPTNKFIGFVKQSWLKPTTQKLKREEKNMKKIIYLNFEFCLFTLSSFAETKYVTAKSLNVRSGAGPENPVVAKLTQNQQVNVISEKGGWSKIKNGWVASRFLSQNKSTVFVESTKEIYLNCGGKLINLTDWIEKARDNTVTEMYKYWTENDMNELYKEIKPSFNGWIGLKGNNDSKRYDKGRLDLNRINGTLVVESMYFAIEWGEKIRTTGEGYSLACEKVKGKKF